MCDNQHRCEKNEHKGEGMDVGDLHEKMNNKDERKPLDTTFQEQRMQQEGGCQSEKCDQKKLEKRSECEGKKECGNKGGSCH